MSMSENVRENEELEAATSVELSDEVQEDVVEDSSDDETRTSVRKKSSGDDELENYSESVQRRINQLTAKRKQASICSTGSTAKQSNEIASSTARSRLSC